MWRGNKNNAGSASLPQTRSGGSPAPLRWSKVVLTGAIVLAVGVPVVLGLKALARKRMVGKVVSAVRTAGGENLVSQIRIQLNRPAWMPVELARSIAASLAPAPRMSFARARLAQEVYDRACSHPLIRQVEPVRRLPGDNPQTDVVVVQAQFRRPVGRVAGPGGYVYVDSEGVRLPVDMIPAWVRPGAGGGKSEYYLSAGGHRPTPDCRAIHYILINGAQAAMPAVGQAWEGQDVRDGIRLVELASSHPWANQVVTIDVHNHQRRADPNAPEIILIAQRGQSKPTLIRFGRFPRDDEPFMIPTDRKLAYLDAYAQRHDGSIAGFNDWLDLRYDKLHVSLE
jgi:hypothetical protein